jgi:hypothetical protein
MLAQYVRFHFMRCSTRRFNVLHNAGCLTQQYIVDKHARMESARLQWESRQVGTSHFNTHSETIMLLKVAEG